MAFDSSADASQLPPPSDGLNRPTNAITNPALRSRLQQLTADESEVLEQLVGPSAQSSTVANVYGTGLQREVRAWRNLLRDYGLTDQAAGADQLLIEFGRDRATDWCKENLECPLPSDPDVLLRRLARTTSLQLSLPANHDAQHLEVQFQAVRDRLRSELLRVLEQVPPSDGARQRWVSALVDRADATLTAIDETAPDAAAWQLRVVWMDIQWHRDHVETDTGSGRRRLSRRLRRLRAERQERQLQSKLEQKFSPRNVARFERAIFWLIFFVLGLIVVEFMFDLSERTLVVLHVADGVICCVFLWEFFYKLALVEEKWLWFRRHALIDLLPSIPFGLLTIATASPANSVRAGRAVRLVRVSRLVRYVRILRPLVRMIRAFGFLVRGLDRLARSYGRVLNRNIILFPTREERQRGREEQESPQWQLRTRRVEIETRWRETLSQAEPEHRDEIAAARLDVFAEALRREKQISHAIRDISDEEAPPIGEVPAELALRRMASTTPQEVRMVLGDELTRRVARMVRTFSWPPLRWLPVFSAFAPRISRRMSDEEVVAAAAHSASQPLGKYYARYLWFGDLYGTVTPSQFLDRLGGMLVKASFRPTYRLALFGGLFLLTQQLIGLIPLLKNIRDALAQIVGTPLVILGGVCVLVLGVGWWLKRLAREATEFYERAAQAQFLGLTEDFRSRNVDPDSEIIHERVLRFEWNLMANGNEPLLDRAARIDEFRQRVHMSLVGNNSERGKSFNLLERTALIYRDSLDGAMFADTDTRATGQLLGNLSVQQALQLSSRVTRRDKKSLRVLDLERQKSLFGGPYLWFNFISRSIAHSAAVLIVDYNKNAIPLAELDLASPTERQRYEAWVSAESELFNTDDVPSSWEYSTTAFTALHFLDDMEARDADVARRFGENVRDKMRRDRGLLFRRVFGTYPLHRRQKELRLLNVYVLYDKWLGGGKAVFLPLVFFFRGCKTVARSCRWVIKAIKEVRNPNRRARYDDAADADFATAVRKIDRMRGPITRATITLRAKFDPAYVGIPLPGETTDKAIAPQFEEDLRFLDADPEFVRQLRDFRRRAVRDIRRLQGLIDAGLLAQLEQVAKVPAGSFQTDEHRRAAAIVYAADYEGIRTLISGMDVLERVATAAPAMHLPAAKTWFAWRRKSLFKRWWKQIGQRLTPTGSEDDSQTFPQAANAEDLADGPAAHSSSVVSTSPQSTSSEGGKRADVARQAAWRAIHNNLDGAGLAMLAWGKHGAHAEGIGRQRLANILRHPNRISEHLVALRTIQTLAMLDIVHYRSHVFRLGEYAATEGTADDLLIWRGSPGTDEADQARTALMEAGQESHEVLE